MNCISLQKRERSGLLCDGQALFQETPELLAERPEVIGIPGGEEIGGSIVDRGTVMMNREAGIGEVAADAACACDCDALAGEACLAFRCVEGGADDYLGTVTE